MNPEDMKKALGADKHIPGVGDPSLVGHPHFSSSSDLIAELARARAELERAWEDRNAWEDTANHWKANHASMVELNRLLRDRPDLGDRAQRVTQLIEERNRLKDLLRELYAVTSSSISVDNPALYARIVKELRS